MLSVALDSMVCLTDLAGDSDSMTSACLSLYCVTGEGTVEA